VVVVGGVLFSHVSTSISALKPDPVRDGELLKIAWSLRRKLRTLQTSSNLSVLLPKPLGSQSSFLSLVPLPSCPQALLLSPQHPASASYFLGVSLKSHCRLIRDPGTLRGLPRLQGN
jgi:hypothetical protein